MPDIFGRPLTKDEAFDIFEGMEQLQIARLIAEELCREHGWTNGNLVVEEMERRDLRDGSNLHWKGSIFKNGKFRCVSSKKITGVGRDGKPSHDGLTIEKWVLI